MLLLGRGMYHNENIVFFLQVVTDYDSEMIAQSQIPTLVIGTKLDQMKGAEPQPSFIADDCNAEEIYIDCTSNRYIKL